MQKQTIPIERSGKSYLVGVFLDHVDEDGYPDVQLCAAPKCQLTRDPINIKVVFVRTKGFTKPLISKKAWGMTLK